MSDKKIETKSETKQENKIHEDSYYSKENLYYKREKRKNIFLIIIIFILLIYMWFCFTYHWGYIKESGERNGKNSVDTSGNVIGNENKTSTNTSTDNLGQTQKEGPYQLNSQNLKEETENTTALNLNNLEANINKEENTTDTPVNNLTPEEIKKIKLVQEENQKNFNELENLNIFKNLEYSEAKLIYPGLSGIYNFNVENYTTKNIMYKLTLEEYNPKNVNMKYKLKRNGKYIEGNENQYLAINELTNTEMQLNSMTGDSYTLYWKWEDSANDINVASPIERGEYTLRILGRV